MTRTEIRTASAVILLMVAGLPGLPGCGSEGVKQAQAEIPDRDDDDLAGHRPSGQASAATQPTPEAATQQAPAAQPEPQPARTEAPARPARSARASTPAPTAVRLTVPTFTAIDVELLTAISSETSQQGELFTARVTRDVMVGDHVAIPAGAEAGGTVTEAVATKKIGGQARLTLDFQTLTLANGESTGLAATLTTEGRKQTAKDTATIGGATAGGAILGRVLAKDKKKGTAIGAVVGAAAGTTIAANNASDPVEFAEGTVVSLSLQEPIFVVLTGNSRRFTTPE